MKFNLNNRVKIKKNSGYYNSNSPSNPKDVYGTIIAFEGKSIKVNWDNGEYNYYLEHDLELINSNYPVPKYKKGDIIKFCHNCKKERYGEIEKTIIEISDEVDIIYKIMNEDYSVFEYEITKVYKEIE